MPNIIEQQDLLKGLTDQRLASLMQAPTGDIPPFLVAAEAQRRQSIRAQFGGGGQSESVVDSLTREMAGTPQDVNANPAAPPAPPPQAGGINDIPQEQPQGMADGGPVRRFNTGGGIAPLWNVPSYSGAIPKVMDWIGATGKSVYDFATTPYSEWEKQVDEDNDPSDEDDNVKPGQGTLDIDYPEAKIEKGRFPFPSATPVADRSPRNGTTDTSPENQYKAKEADFRKRIEALYGDQESSNWEDAQKWFAMAGEFYDPNNRNLGQSIAAAGAQYAGYEAEQAQAAREAAAAKEEMLLKYDMGLYEADRAAAGAAASKAADRAFEMKKLGMPSANSALDAYQAMLKSVEEKLADMSTSSEQRAVLERQKEMYLMQIARIMNAGGFGPEGNKVITSADTQR